MPKNNDTMAPVIVYVVMCHYSDYEQSQDNVEAIFFRRDLADAYLREKIPGYLESYEIEEHAIKNKA